MTASTAGPVTRASVPVKLLAIVLAGAAVSISLGVYGRVHDPTGEKPYTLFFSDTINLKVWFATARCSSPRSRSSWRCGCTTGSMSHARSRRGWVTPAPAHRGRHVRAGAAVVYQCLWALGFQSTDGRVLLHSLLGCFFFGAFTIKVLAVRTHGLPNWLLPVVGGTVFTTLVLIWTTSAVWFWRCSASRASEGGDDVQAVRQRDRDRDPRCRPRIRRRALRQRARGGSAGTAKSGPGYDVFLANCARCHGQDGQGGIGPKLAGVVTTDFPDAQAEIAVVRDGRASMPSFKNDLSATQIQDVVAYTRTQLK